MNSIISDNKKLAVRNNFSVPATTLQAKPNTSSASGFRHSFSQYSIAPEQQATPAHGLAIQLKKPINISKEQPIQMITKWGILGALGLAGAAVAATASAPLLAAGGLAVAGSAYLGRKWTETNTQRPKDAPNLNEKQSQDLEEFRKKNKLQPLGVKYDAAFTDELAGRRRDPGAYRQWQLGKPNNDIGITGKDGNPLGDGRYIYVVTVENEFRYLPMLETEKEHFDQYRTHSQLAGKQDVFAAGAFVVQKNEITEINNESGHYQPPNISNAEYARTLLTMLGYNAGKATLKTHDSSGDPKGKDYLASQVKANARALKTWIPPVIPGIKKPGWENGFPEPSENLKPDLPF